MTRSESAPIAPVVSAPAPVADAAPAPAIVATTTPPAAKPPDAAPPASFKLVGTVVTANGSDSFAMVRRTADSQLVQLRAGDRVEGLTVSAIESGDVVLAGTVVTANGADSFAMVRRTADSQLVQLRAGDRVEGLTVSAIESGDVVLAGAGQAVVIEADRTVAAPTPFRALIPPPAPDVEPAWAGDPAPFGH